MSEAEGDFMDTTKTKATNKLGRPDKESIACKARGREATMDRLMCAAVQVFSAHGYDAATTKLVAKEAGINESLINRYFEGKAGLLLAIIKSYVECERETGPWATYPEGQTVEEDLKSFFSTSIKHHAQRRELLKIFMSRAMVDMKVRDELKALKKDGAPRPLIEHLEKFQKRGLIRKDVDVKMAAIVVSSACFSMGFINHVVMGFDQKLIEEGLKTFARDYSRGIGPTNH
jgi:AcrR family transcriptional regulator